MQSSPRVTFTVPVSVDTVLPAALVMLPLIEPLNVEPSATSSHDTAIAIACGGNLGILDDDCRSIAIATILKTRFARISVASRRAMSTVSSV